MSYDLVVIATDSSADDGAVREHVRRVMDEVGTGGLGNGPSTDPRIAAFRAELLRRYPDEVDGALDGDALDAALRRLPWSVFPLGDPEPDHWYLCMGFSWANEVHAVVEQLAAAHGLVLYDPQADEITRPDPSRRVARR